MSFRIRAVAAKSPLKSGLLSWNVVITKFLSLMMLSVVVGGAAVVGGAVVGGAVVGAAVVGARVVAVVVALATVVDGACVVAAAVTVLVDLELLVAAPMTSPTSNVTKARRSACQVFQPLPGALGDPIGPVAGP